MSDTAASAGDRADLEDKLRQATLALEKSFDLTLEALVDALHLKHPETAAHSKRVTAFAIAVARAMRLSSEQIRVTARGAILHDLGKLGVPDSILRKPGPLDPAETEMMRAHCRAGQAITTKFPYLREAAEIIYSHHENWDGSGYPRGLRGEVIPLGARIVSLANAFDAITSDKSYRAGRPYDEAVKEIERCAGSQFDPKITEVLLGLPENMLADLRKSVMEHSS